MVRSISIVACLFFAILSLDIVASRQVEDRDLLGFYSRTQSRIEKRRSRTTSTGNNKHLLCHCMSIRTCTGAQVCNSGDSCMVAMIGGQVKAAGCIHSSICTSPVYTCCKTDMCNTLPGQGAERTTMKDATTRQIEMTVDTHLETTSAGLTSVKSSQRVLVAFLIAITLNFYERK